MHTITVKCITKIEQYSFICFGVKTGTMATISAEKLTWSLLGIKQWQGENDFHSNTTVSFKDMMKHKIP